VRAACRRRQNFAFAVTHLRATPMAHGGARALSQMRELS
jgi:hypothetical protein